MNEWLLWEIESTKDSPDHYEVEFRGSGTPNVALILLLQAKPGSNAQILSVYLHPELIPGTNETVDSNPILTPARLREIPYGRLTAMAQPFIDQLRQSGHQMMMPTPPDALHDFFDFDALKAEWPKGDLAAVSDAVSGVYEAALSVGEPPKTAVAEAFKTSLTTAGRMIAKARELGILNVSSVGGRPKAKGTDNGQESTKRR